MVACLETHGALVFLAGDYAYKLKRAVHLPYLDFSTPAKRHAVCRNEIRINRRTAPDLYLGILAVERQADGQLTLNANTNTGAGAEEVLDWVIKMRRFPDDALLSQVAEAGGLTPRIVHAVADTIAAFHGAAETSSAWGGADELARIARSDAGTIARFTPDLFDPGQSGRVARATLAAIEAQRVLLEWRRQNGFVSHTHGDLHLANIYLDGNRPTLFDAIEFDDRLAQNDALYDLAFLLMDLWHRGLRGEANRVFNRYLLRTDDLGGLPALPLFLSMRAGIRTQVCAITAAGQNDNTAQGSEAMREDAGRYMDLAAAALAPPPPLLVALGGFSGSGKSHLGAALAPLLGAMPGAVHLRSDEIRKVMLGQDPETPLDQTAYTSAVSGRVYGQLRHRAGQALEAGHAVIADAVHNRPDSRDVLAKLAARCGVPFLGIWLDADPALMADRIRRRRDDASEDAMKDASDADAGVMQRQVRHDAGKITWRRLDAGAPLAEKVAQVQAWVGAVFR